MKQEKPIIISLGGSLIVPKEIDWKFLKKFRKIIISQIKKGKKFVIIAGGGKTCRNYQEAANKVVKLTNDDMDWLGIHATRLNAHLIKTIFRRYAYPRINKNPRTKENLKNYFSEQKRVIIAAGWRPGWSTDFVATILAKRLGAKTVINLSNIKYVYDKDPNKFKDAKKIKQINWIDFRKIVGNKWNPGANLPFDPVASKEAKEQDLKVIIADGKNIDNFNKILNEKPFEGTIIEN